MASEQFFLQKKLTENMLFLDYKRGWGEPLQNFPCNHPSDIWELGYTNYTVPYSFQSFTHRILRPRRWIAARQLNFFAFTATVQRSSGYTVFGSRLLHRGLSRTNGLESSFEVVLRPRSRSCVKWCCQSNSFSPGYFIQGAARNACK